MTDTHCRISIIVPIFNASEYLHETLGTIRKSNYSNFELIVVDDCSTDGSLEIAKQFADRTLEMKKNQGPAIARNQGAKVSSGAVLFFLDADVRLHPNTLLKVVNVMNENPEYAAVFGSYDDHPFHTNFFSQYKNLFHHFVHQNAKSESSTFWAGCGAIRNEDFETVGGISGKYASASIEDVELGYKLKDYGKRIKLEKDIQVTHLKKWTFFSLVKTDIVYRAVSWTELAVRRGLPYDLNFKVSDRLSGLAAVLLILNLVLSFFWMPAAFIALSCGCFLFFVNRRLYFFFREKGGGWFAFFSTLFHWFYFFYSSITFAICAVVFCVRQYFRKRRLDEDMI